MLFPWKISVLLLLAAGGGAQSGDGDSDPEVGLSCTSHISTVDCSLTCWLTVSTAAEDDEDMEWDSIVNMTMCQSRWEVIKKTVKCWEALKDTVTGLHALPDVDVTAQLKKGSQVSTTVNLYKIVKPRSPRVWNITVVPESNQTVIYIQTPYKKDYLTLDNQVFQLHIWTNRTHMIQNISSKNFLQIDEQRLSHGSEYHVKVRSIPAGDYLQGTWSEWSEMVSFYTLPGETTLQTKMEEWHIWYRPAVCVICLVVIMASGVFFLKNKIFTYMWPSIPHPKKTLVQICKLNKGLLLNLNPEVFSSLKVYPLEKTDSDEVEPSFHPTAPDGFQSNSTQSSHCSSTTSNSTEELEISALLIRSSFEGKDSLLSTNPSPLNILQLEDRPHTPQPEDSRSVNGVEIGVNQQEEAYVTMSSFYQINCSVLGGGTAGLTCLRMPLFFRKRKPNDDSQKRLECQLCQSKEAGADDILDISGCQLSEVPSSAFSICRVLQKKVLILHTNELRSLLPIRCDISCLSTLKVLDLHDNKLSTLPEDMGNLTSLQILNVEKNRLKVLPESIGNLQLLQTLNLKGNCLTELPSSVGSLSSLRTLDVRDNNVLQLPKALGYIHTLESLTLDAAAMTYPPAAVCSEGTESIQRFLCRELGVEYCPPSQYLLPVLENNCDKQNSDCVDGLEEAWKNKITDYETRKEQKQQEKLAFERLLEEKQKEHTRLLLTNNSHKENILNLVRQEQERVDQAFSLQQRCQEADRQLVLEKVRQAEDNFSSRINSLLKDNSRQKKAAEFLQAMEEDRIRMEQLTTITQEEADSLREKDVAAAMQKMLLDNNAMRFLQEVKDFRRQNVVSEACRSMEALDRKFDRMMSLQVLDKSKAIAQILQEDEMQKAAFQVLQLQKDAVHGYIRNQIKVIEGELMQVTKLEVKRRSLDSENLQEILVEQRTALSDLLQQLLKQRDQREQELLQVLVEMEKKSDSNQQNYWMIQYQRLLDAKPLSLRMQEAGVEEELVNLLCRLSAQHYLPVLAHYHITTKTLQHMTISDLKKVGINETGLQTALLSWAQERHPAAGACKAVEQEEDVPKAPSSSSPPPSFPSTSIIQTPSPTQSPRTPVTPSAPVPVDGPGSSECVVCMETETQIIFLPCGHVCSCQVCSNALQKCPLCRSYITQRIRLYLN
ncbi:E3 ubiquitin-protein ligase LRSAM1 [Nematolebias whitei]|uniref:E3 ubiquitin-protein ligase LRSAM1 n=1 Tax=Nematolebias whitei TaxID=451745 RepID=UPI001898E80B|nr:E3 ubiquitin-protein ligase LRSAM1 [Nematolebias whitei]